MFLEFCNCMCDRWFDWCLWKSTMTLWLYHRWSERSLLSSSRPISWMRRTES
uniref:Uncharacterized protein n=1 Tax=Anguilla anguilla TaxID=7936 RepID=A0A0E9QBU8_ANGAN